MNTILCLLALCALLNGHSFAVAEDELGSDLYLEGAAKGYEDEYEDEGSAVEYDDGSAGYPYTDGEYEDSESEEGSGQGRIVRLSDCEELLQRVQKKNLVGAYEPRCTATGEYEPMQCSGGTGECWCVNNDGITIPGTMSKSPWEPDCTNVDRNRKYPQVPVIDKKPVDAKPTISAESEEEEIVEEDGNGKNKGNTGGVDIGQAEDEGETTGDQEDTYGSTQEKLERSGILGQPLILAGLIAIAVVCLLCAVLLVMFIVYRMRKKDEGSYALDEPKRSPAHPYQRAPTREYFA